MNKTVEVITNCGNDTKHEDTKEINSPKYPSNYLTKVNCFWKLVAPTGRRIRLHLNELKFDTQKCRLYHYLRISDGPSSSSKQLHKLHEINKPMDVVSSTEYLYVNMVISYYGSCSKTINDRGFHLDYSYGIIFNSNRI